MNKEIDDNEQLLPWLVNGTLEGDEKTRVEAWLESQEDGDELRAFDEALREQVRSEQVGSPGAFGLRRLQKEIQSERRLQKPANDNRWWRPAIAAAALVIVVQGGVIFDQFRDQGEYTPLGVEQTGIVLQVEFAPDATQQQISELLQGIDAEIVGGPAASGLYRLQLVEEDANADEAMAALRSAAEIVRYAGTE